MDSLQRARQGEPLPSYVPRAKGINFYPLNLHSSSVIMIDTVAAYENTLIHLKEIRLIGLDCEWKPTLQTYESEEIALFQISTKGNVFLFDMLSLPKVLTEKQWEKLGALFSNDKVEKLCYGFDNNDRKALSSLSSSLKAHIDKMCTLIDLNIAKQALQHVPHLFPFKTSKHKGLSELIFKCFGLPLDKREQCSYWSVRPLSREQITYAAIDAFCLLEIYYFLNKVTVGTNALNWKSLKPGMRRRKGQRPQGQGRRQKLRLRSQKSKKP